jgi:hypothetical protein
MRFGSRSIHLFVSMTDKGQHLMSVESIRNSRQNLRWLTMRSALPPVREKDMSVYTHYENRNLAGNIPNEMLTKSSLIPGDP